MKRMLALALCFSMAFGGAPAYAVDEAMAPGEIEARIAELEARQQQIPLRGPRVGTILGGVLVGAGGFLALLTVGVCNENRGCPSDPFIGLGVGGAVLLLSGIAALVPSSQKLRARKRERKEIQEEIRALEARRAAAKRSRFRIGLLPEEQFRSTSGRVDSRAVGLP